MEQTLSKIESRLRAAGIPFYNLRVYGSIRCRIVIEVLGIASASKWSNLLNGFCSEVNTLSTTVEAKDQSKNRRCHAKRIAVYRVYGVI